MKKIRMIFIVMLIALGCTGASGALAQELKASSGVNQAYSNIGVDVQCYEIKYDPKSDEYVSYYKVIREKIIQKLKGLYRYHYKNGDVYIFFTLNSDGKLDGFDVDYSRSVNDKTLIDIATTSLKRSSPFPKFPQGLSSPKVSFDVIISFKES